MKKVETHIIKIATLHGCQAEKLFFYEQSDNASLFFNIKKDVDGEYIAEIFAEFLVGK